MTFSIFVICYIAVVFAVWYLWDRRRKFAYGSYILEKGNMHLSFIDLFARKIVLPAADLLLLLHLFGFSLYLNHYVVIGGESVTTLKTLIVLVLVVVLIYASYTKIPTKEFKKMLQNSRAFKEEERNSQRKIIINFPRESIEGKENVASLATFLSERVVLENYLHLNSGDDYVLAAKKIWYVAEFYAKYYHHKIDIFSQAHTIRREVFTRIVSRLGTEEEIAQSIFG